MILPLAAVIAAQAAPPVMVAPPPAVPQYTYAAPSADEQASQQAFNKFVADMFDAPPDPVHRAAQVEFMRIRDSLREIAHRQPFDAIALKAYRALGEAKGRLEARRNEMVAERLGKLPPAERRLVIERIPELAALKTPSPPPRK